MKMKTLLCGMAGLALLRPFPVAAAPEPENPPPAGAPAAGPLSEAAAAFGRGEYESAIKLATAAARKMEADASVPRADVVTAWGLAGDGEAKRSRHSHALLAYQKALSVVDKSSDPKLWALAAVSVAGVLPSLGEHQLAYDLNLEIVHIREEEFGPLAGETAETYGVLAMMLQKWGKNREAELYWRRALAAREASQGKDHASVGIVLNNLAALLIAAHRPAEAEPHIRRAIAISEAAGGPENADLGDRLNNLGAVLLQTSRPAEAEPVFRRVLAIWDKPPGKDKVVYASGLTNLTHALRALDRNTEAEPLMRRALEMHESVYGKDHPIVAEHLNDLGTLLAELKRFSEAEPVMRRALEIYLNATVATGRPDPGIKTSVGNYKTLLLDMGESESNAKEKITKMIEPFDKRLAEKRGRQPQPQQPAAR